jgi:lipopolysaccharide/colanic/teichoic acid biosynthesis glycosyltransferase
MIVLALPVSVPIGILIKLEDGGPVFYRQKRWGRNGLPFRAYKFRTMTPNSDQMFGIRPAQEDDHRVTRIGRILRAMGLDELPQVLNILRGDMSFVGPRALAVKEVVTDQNGDVVDYRKVRGFRERLQVRPGLTSSTTIYIPKDSPPEKKFLHDLSYVENLSFSEDLRLIALSYWISFRGKWESRQKKL